MINRFNNTLDEATSAADCETEEKISESSQLLMTGKTTFLIAHRYSTIRSADRIFVLKYGGFVEAGTHEELLEKGGEYTELYHKQMQITEVLGAASRLGFVEGSDPSYGYIRDRCCWRIQQTPINTKFGGFYEFGVNRMNTGSK